MAKKRQSNNPTGRPPMDPDQKLSEIVGYRFTPADADEIRLATKYDDALIQRIRDAILREVRKKKPRQKPKARRL